MLSLDKKLEMWEQTLEPDKLVLIAHAIKTEIKNLEDNINFNIENCMGAAIGDFTDLNIKEIKQIVKRSYEYMADTEKYIKENGVKWMNKIEKVEEDIKQFLRKEMEAGALKSQAMAKAKKKFDIPAKEISNLWLIVKEEDYPELCRDKGLSVEQSSRDYEKRRKQIINAKNKGDTEEKEVKGINSQENKEKGSQEGTEMQKVRVKTSLVEITEVRKFKGQFGEYEKSKDGVKVEDILIKDVKGVEEQKAAVEEDIKKMRQEFEKTVSQKRSVALGKLNEVMELLSM